MGILQILFLVNICGCPQALSLANSDILEIVKLSRDVVIDLEKTIKLLDEDVGMLPKVKDQRVLFEEFKVFNNKINMLSSQLEGTGSQVLNAIVNYTNVQVLLKLQLKEVIKNIDFINLKYKDIGTFIDGKADYDDFALDEFARSVVSHTRSSSRKLLDRIHAIIVPEKDSVPSVFDILIEIMMEQGNKMFCNMQTSEQQLHLNLYNTLALTELKGFLMMEFSYMVLKLHNKGNFDKEIAAVQERYKDRSATTLKLFIEAVTWADYDLWKCDPYKQVKNETYIEITELLQGYIENLEDIDTLGSCKYNCHNYNDYKSKKCNDYKGENMFCNKNKQCKGKLMNCTHIRDSTVCHADAGTNRRYDYIQYRPPLPTIPGLVLGRKKECEDNSTEFKEWTRFFQSSIFSTCNYCMCLCDEQGVNSDRYFSLRSSESDIDDNMVVTGLRFVKKSRIIHLQIQEGKLLPSAKIDVASVHWKPVKNYKIGGRKVLNGRDYHTLTWWKRSFDLDDLVAKDDELVTGVRFKMIGSHLNFQIRLTPFNFTTGTMLVARSLWKLSGIPQEDRIKLYLDEKDIPIMSPDRSLPLSQNGMYLEFTPTDLYKDVLQTTVPFIDAQPVASAKPVPLCGAGVSYKGSKNFGGFIYPKIMTYDYSKLFFDEYDNLHFGNKVVNKK